MSVTGYGQLGTGPVGASVASSAQGIRFGQSQVSGLAGSPSAWYAAGLWGITQAQALAFNILFAVPYVTGRNFLVDRFGFWITSVGGANSRTRLGIYRAENGVGLPTEKLLDTGDFDTDGGPATIRLYSGQPLPLTLSDPLYWFALVHGIAPVTPTIQTIAATDGQPIGGFAEAGTGRQTHLQAAYVHTLGTPLPATYPLSIANFVASNYPLIAVRGA